MGITQNTFVWCSSLAALWKMTVVLSPRNAYEKGTRAVKHFCDMFMLFQAHTNNHYAQSECPLFGAERTHIKPRVCCVQLNTPGMLGETGSINTFGDFSKRTAQTDNPFTFRSRQKCDTQKRMCPNAWTHEKGTRDERRTQKYMCDVMTFVPRYGWPGERKNGTGPFAWKTVK